MTGLKTIALIVLMATSFVASAQSLGSSLGNTSGSDTSSWAGGIRADTTQAQPPADKGEKMPLIKRQHHYRDQIYLALGMMLFVAFIMTSTDNWNPR